MLNLVAFLKPHKQFAMFVAIDTASIALAAYFSFLIRFDGIVPADRIIHVYAVMVLGVLCGLPVFYWQGLYRFNWNFISLRDITRIIKAVFFTTLILAAILFVFRDVPILNGFPRSIILINFFLMALGVGGWRVSKRIFVESTRKNLPDGARLLIIGAGSAGEEVARSISKMPNHNLIGFIDDAPQKRNNIIHDAPVLGARHEISSVAKKYSIEEAIIAFPSADHRIIRETVELCRAAEIKKIKILPSFREIVDEQTTVSNIRELSIDDLLGRDVINIDPEDIQKLISGKRVLVTGAAGSIGSTLCKQILKFSPAKLIALDMDETGLFYLDHKLKEVDSGADKKFVICNICDNEKINAVFNDTKPEIVFHAAAYKHVPLMEDHPDEAIKNNILGLQGVAEAALNNGVEKFIFISTDKAVNPSSVMGMTKRAGEMICQSLNQQNKTKFISVRFGNVLDSRGNVISLFKRQIKKGGPVEVTHPDMTRYFMITSESVLLVMQAGAIGNGGEIFLLDMGEPIKILDLAREMIKLSGYEPDVDIPIVFTNPRPGEKMFEKLLTTEEASTATKHQKIFITKVTLANPEPLNEALKFFGERINLTDLAKVVEKLRELTK